MAPCVNVALQGIVKAIIKLLCFKGTHATAVNLAAQGLIHTVATIPIPVGYFVPGGMSIVTIGHFLGGNSKCKDVKSLIGLAKQYDDALRDPKLMTLMTQFNTTLTKIWKSSKQTKNATFRGLVQYNYTEFAMVLWRSSKCK
jgi:hypothetical protein